MLGRFWRFGEVLVTVFEKFLEKVWEALDSVGELLGKVLEVLQKVFNSLGLLFPFLENLGWSHLLFPIF